MNKFTSLMTLLPLALFSQASALAGPLGIPGAAGQYNVFVFNDLTLTETDVEGRAAAGGNVKLESFAIGSRVQQGEGGIPSLVAGNNVTLLNGSVGCLPAGNPSPCPDPQKGTIVYGGAQSITGVGFKAPAILKTDQINFAAERSNLEGLSVSWAGFAANGIDVDPTANFDLTGTDSSLNVFSISAAEFGATHLDFDFHAPVGSTILVNVTGNLPVLNLHNIGFSFNGIPGENIPGPGEIYSHNAGYPYSSILFNFVDAKNIDLDQIALNGTLFAPFADVTFTKDSHVDGNLIAMSLSGFGESHAIPFVGDISAVPEPTTLLLLAGALFGLVARRRLS